jgi:hypothetical protein
MKVPQHRDQQLVHIADDMPLDKYYLNIGYKLHKIHHRCCTIVSNDPVLKCEEKKTTIQASHGY